MSERKVLNKYYPPDFDPSKIPRMKLPKNRQYTVRLMAPFNMRCETCGEYIYKGKKFNARKEDVENEDYLGIRIYRFYIKCTRCLQEISFKTDPKSTDYVIEAGATRNFMALKLAEEQALREEEEAKEEEANNPMKLLENRTKQSKNEIEQLESLEEIKDMNRRQEAIDYNAMLLQYDSKLTEREREEKMQQMDEEYIKTITFGQSNKRKVVVEEEIIDEEPYEKNPRTDEIESKDFSTDPDPIVSSSTSSFKWELTSNVKPVKKPGLVLVKPKNNDSTQRKDEVEGKNVENSSRTILPGNAPPSSALSLLGEYSDSEESDN
ncbi:splicing factor YJU2 [Coccinella septempunctata]|uniref:splicing factor YJU2 n=1 Tax=Coccinella septempunctata TaxID=41139 RepID=UPI001D07CC4F|nr:splicing factor YJU2 [Coccinella septempunctata]